MTHDYKQYLAPSLASCGIAIDTSGPSRIVLSRDSRGWNARYYGPAAAHVYNLFGCDYLPTAYSAVAEPHFVLAGIRRNNPGVIVELGSVS
jgi:hypothetical protein